MKQAVAVVFTHVHHQFVITQRQRLKIGDREAGRIMKRVMVPETVNDGTLGEATGELTSNIAALSRQRFTNKIIDPIAELGPALVHLASQQFDDKECQRNSGPTLLFTKAVRYPSYELQPDHHASGILAFALPGHPRVV